ncbi:Zinc finger protein, partial [Pseudolycoriella hygida]
SYSFYEHIDTHLEPKSDSYSEDYDVSIWEPICQLDIEGDTDDDGDDNSIGTGSNGALVTLPQGPGRGRRPVIDNRQLENTQSTALCFFQCDICDNSFPFSGDLAIHVRSHTSDNPFRCKICRKNFPHVASLSTHIRIHSGETPYKCDICSKGFRQSSSLAVHKRGHYKKPYQCDKCNKGFTNPDDLASHISGHDKDDEFPCSYCKKRFTKSHLLEKHLQVHTDKYHYECAICGKAFETSKELTQHLKYHTGEKPFKCILCRKTYTSTGSLKTHVEKCVQQKKERPCPICGERTNNAEFLIQHINDFHPIPLGPLECCVCHKTCDNLLELCNHYLEHTVVFTNDSYIAVVNISSNGLIM